MHGYAIVEAGCCIQWVGLFPAAVYAIGAGPIQIDSIIHVLTYKYL